MMLDTLGRPLRNLRLSVTDRCNLRCQYCMPEEDYVWLPREDILHFEEIERARRRLPRRSASTRCGSPAASRCCAAICRVAGARCSPRKPGLDDLALTTNGVLLADQIDGAQGRRPAAHHGQPRHAAARSLHGADALRRARRACTAGIARRAPRVRPASRSTRWSSAASTTTSWCDLIEYGRTVERRGAVHRVHGRRRRHALVAGATSCRAREMLAALTAHYGPIEPIVERTRRRRPTASRCRTARPFGIISSTTEPFCRTCDRSRLTADGMWYLCLYATPGIDLRAPLRRGASPPS